MFTPISLMLPDNLSEDLGERMSASAAFERITGRSMLRGLRNRIKGTCGCLLSLSAVASRTRQRNYVGVHLVPIDQIRGSEGREKDFDVDFNPLQEHDKQRWMGVLVAMRRGAILPPVDLILAEGIYYVRDGHHRISAAKQLGLREIEAEITVWE